MTVEATPSVRPRLADGVELIGKYEDSGFKDEPYLARRADGQMIQMPRLLYVVAESVDGRRDYAEIAATVSERARVGLSDEGAEMLVEERLRPLGLVAQPDGSTPEVEKPDPLLALKLKTAVVPDSLVNAVAKTFRPLFFPPVIAIVLAAFVALDAWLFVVHGVAQSIRHVLYEPFFILLLLGLVVLSAAFHECGHATACKYGGARPGVMGVGIYLVWPAFYTDVTDAYRLSKRGRLRTDLGGVYFNSIFSVATFGAYFATGWEPLLLVVPLQIMEMLHQFLPFIRLDGYYIVSDLTGVPDMFARIKPTLKSLNPLRETPHEVRVLKPWVRHAVTLYVFTVVPLLLFLLGLTVINMPRVVATAWDSMLQQNMHLHLHVGMHAYTHVALDALQMSVLVLPVAGLAVTFWKLGRTIATGLWDWGDGRTLVRLAVVVGSVIAVFGAAYTWLPNGDYRPIQAADRGTIGSVAQELGGLATGRPSFTRRRGIQPKLQTTEIGSDRFTNGDNPAGRAATTGGADTTVTTTTDTGTTSRSLELKGSGTAGDSTTPADVPTFDTSTTDTPVDTGATDSTPTDTTTSQMTTTPTTTTDTTP